MNMRLTFLALASLPALALAQTAPPCVSTICGPASVPLATQQAQAQNWQHAEALWQQTQAPITQEQQGLNQFEQQQAQQNQARAEQEQANTQWQEMMNSQPGVPSWAQNYEPPPSAGDWEELNWAEAELNHLQSDAASVEAALTVLAKERSQLSAQLTVLIGKQKRYNAACPSAYVPSPAATSAGVIHASATGKYILIYGTPAHANACGSAGEALAKKAVTILANVQRNTADITKGQATLKAIIVRIEALPH